MSVMFRFKGRGIRHAITNDNSFPAVDTLHNPYVIWRDGFVPSDCDKLHFRIPSRRLAFDMAA